MKHSREQAVDSINSISELHGLLSLSKPEHPLISVIRFEDMHFTMAGLSNRFTQNYYAIAIKKGFKGKMKYGQHFYDFDEGIMSFFAPGQVICEPKPEDRPPSGWTLIFHPDFLLSYPLGKSIKNYGYFSYEVNEALHLSDKEELLVESIVRNIESEYRSVTDLFSQDLIVSHLELLLNYSNRFYNRQFITRKQASNDLLTRLDRTLNECFKEERIQNAGIPTVSSIAAELNLSPGYLSDMLRVLTGQSAQHHIHEHLIPK